MKAALYSIVTVYDCYINIGKSCNELFGCKFLKLYVLGIFNDVFNSCVDACIVLKLDDTFLCKE